MSKKPRSAIVIQKPAPVTPFCSVSHSSSVKSPSSPWSPPCVEVVASGAYAFPMICPTCGQENPDERALLHGLRHAARARAASRARGAQGRHRPLRRPRRLHRPRRAARSGGRARAARARTTRACASELERFGGTVEKFIGDAVMARLRRAGRARGRPGARGARGARRSATRPELNERPGARPARADRRQHRRGARRARRAPRPRARAWSPATSSTRPRGCRRPRRSTASSSARRPTARPSGSIEYRERRAGRGQGQGGAGPGLGGGRTPARASASTCSSAAQRPLVGRGDELDCSSDALARALRERAPQLVTLVGVPGIGKSRLVCELVAGGRRRAGADRLWRQGRSLPYGEGVAFWALAEIVKAQAGILESDSGRGGRGEAARRRSRTSSPTPRARAGSSATCGRWSASAGEGDPSGERRDEAFAAWRRFFEALAERRPLVLVFEDLHWADDGLLDFVDQLVDWVERRAAARPLHRAAGAARAPARLGRRQARTPRRSRCRRSPDEETARLLASLLEPPVLPAEHAGARCSRGPAATRSTPRSTCACWPSAASHRGRGRCRRRCRGSSPPGSTRSRPTEKALLQDAAVLGQGLLVGALAAMTAAAARTVEERLHALERKELVRRERRSSVASETEYAFRHVLVRDVAYGQIPRARPGGEAPRARPSGSRRSARPRGPRRAARPPLPERARVRPCRRPGRPSRSPSARVSRCARPATAPTASTPSRRRRASTSEALELWPADDPDRGSCSSATARWSRCATRAARASDPGGGARRAARRRRARVGRQAEVALADAHWFSGAPERAREHLRRADKLIEGAPPSRPKAFVLSQVGPFAMLSDDDARAVEVGRERLR